MRVCSGDCMIALLGNLVGKALVETSGQRMISILVCIVL